MAPFLPISFSPRLSFPFLRSSDPPQKREKTLPLHLSPREENNNIPKFPLDHLTLRQTNTFTAKKCAASNYRVLGNYSSFNRPCGLTGSELRTAITSSKLPISPRTRHMSEFRPENIPRSRYWKIAFFCREKVKTRSYARHARALSPREIYDFPSREISVPKKVES